MRTTDSLWEKESEIATYIGGSRSRRNGLFAGLTDIQGMDMYVEKRTKNNTALYKPFLPQVRSCMCSTHTAVPESSAFKRIIRLPAADKKQPHATTNLAILSIT